MKRNQTADNLWHVFKSLLCALQLYILFFLLRPQFVEMWDVFAGEPGTMDTLGHLFPPTIVAALFFVLWNYYDTIDDRSFNRVCAAAEPPKFLRDPAYLLGIAVSALLVTPPLYSTFVPLFRHLRLGSGAIALSLLSALLITVGGSLLRVSRLNTRWNIQSKMPHDKPPSKPLRIFYAAAFFVALLMISKALLIGMMLLTMILITAILPILIGVVLILLWCYVILPALNVSARRTFMNRLQALQDQGKITLTVYGHPYLSLFVRSLPFGMTVKVKSTPADDRDSPTEIPYRVTFANFYRRREIVILCHPNVYQFVYSLKFNHVDRFTRMGANQVGSRAVSLPGMVRYTTHAFDFPDGEGDAVLLIDRVPTVLAFRDEHNSNALFELDNASSVFGYTVYAKNAFLKLLERL